MGDTCTDKFCTCKTHHMWGQQPSENRFVPLISHTPLPQPMPQFLPGPAGNGTIGMRTTAPELTSTVHMKISNPIEAAAASCQPILNFAPHLCQVPPCT